MSLRDLIAINFLVEGPRHNRGMKRHIQTPAEADFVLRAAKRVRLHHAVFNSVRIEWVVNTFDLVLCLQLSMMVQDRNHPTSNPDQLPPIRYFDTETIETTEIAYSHYTRVSLPPEPIRVQSTIAIDLYDHEIVGMDEERLTQRLADVARREILRVLAHEVDEMLMIDDRRVRDPHQSDSR